MFGILIGIGASFVTYMIEDRIDQRIQDRILANKFRRKTMKMWDEMNGKDDE